MLRAGAGYSVTVNPRKAAIEATESALRQAGLRHADAAICFASSQHGGAFPLLVRTVGETAGTDEVAGCGSTGVIANGREIESGPSVAVLVIGEPALGVARFFVPQLRHRALEAAQELAAMVRPRLGATNLLCLFADTYNLEPEPFLAALTKELPGVPIVGGGATEDGAIGETFQFCGDVVSSNSISAMLLRGDFMTTGAKGKTREELTRALGADRILAEDWQACYTNLLQTLRYAAQDQPLTLGNSAWITSGYHLSAEFEQAVTDSFGGEARSLGGVDPAAQINAWAAEKTGGKIAQLLDGLSDEQRLILISCLYFRGVWANPFEERDTKQATFHAPSGDQKRPFMHLESHFNYFENEDTQAISLRYGSRGGLVCFVVLPSRRLGLREFLRRLEPSFWYSLRNAAQYREGSLALPRFRIESSKRLNESLQSAGIRRAFDPKESDFSGIICEPDPVWIGTAQQNTYLEVNEKGTEAAAASFLDMPCMAAMDPGVPPPPFEMVVDRPFFCAIGDVASGLILFTASVWSV